MGNKYSFVQFQQEKNIRKKYRKLNLKYYCYGCRTEFTSSEFKEWEQHDSININTIESQTNCTDYEIEKMKKIYWSEYK